MSTGTDPDGAGGPGTQPVTSAAKPLIRHRVIRVILITVAVAAAGLATWVPNVHPTNVLPQSLLSFLVTALGFLFAGLVFLFERRPREFGISVKIHDGSWRVLTAVAGCGVAAALATLWMCLASMTHIGRLRGAILCALCLTSIELLAISLFYLVSLADNSVLTHRLHVMAVERPSMTKQACRHLMILALDDLESSSLEPFEARSLALAELLGELRDKTSQIVNPDAFASWFQVALSAINHRDFAILCIEPMEISLASAIKEEVPTSDGTDGVQRDALRADALAVDGKLIQLLKLALARSWPSASVISQIVDAHLLTSAIHDGGSEDLLKILLPVALNPEVPLDVWEAASAATEGVATDGDCNGAVHALDGAVATVERLESRGWVSRATELLSTLAGLKNQSAQLGSIAIRVVPYASPSEKDGLLSLCTELDLDKIRQAGLLNEADGRRLAVQLIRKLAGKYASDLPARSFHKPKRAVEEILGKMHELLQGCSEHDVRTLIEGTFSGSPEECLSLRDAWLAALRPTGFAALPGATLLGVLVRRIANGTYDTKALSVCTDVALWRWLEDTAESGFMGRGLERCQAEVRGQLADILQVYPRDSGLGVPTAILRAVVITALELARCEASNQNLTLVGRLLEVTEPPVECDRQQLQELVRVGLSEMAFSCQALYAKAIARPDSGAGDVDVTEESSDDRQQDDVPSMNAMLGLDKWLRSEPVSLSETADDLVAVLVGSAAPLARELLLGRNRHRTDLQLRALFGGVEEAGFLERDFYVAFWESAREVIHDNGIGTRSLAVRPRAVQRLLEASNSLGARDGSVDNRACDAEFLSELVMWLVLHPQVDIRFAMAIIERVAALQPPSGESGGDGAATPQRLVAALSAWCSADDRSGQRTYFERRLARSKALGHLAPKHRRFAGGSGRHRT